MALWDGEMLISLRSISIMFYNEIRAYVSKVKRCNLALQSFTNNFFSCTAAEQKSLFADGSRKRHFRSAFISRHCTIDGTTGSGLVLTESRE